MRGSSYLRLEERVGADAPRWALHVHATEDAMTDAPWDEGPVSALRARIQELELARDVRREQEVLDVATIRKLQAERDRAWVETGHCRKMAFDAALDRDRAVEAVRQLRAALQTIADGRWNHGKPTPESITVHRYARNALAATAEWEAP